MTSGDMRLLTILFCLMGAGFALRGQAEIGQFLIMQGWIVFVGSFLMRKLERTEGHYDG